MKITIRHLRTCPQVGAKNGYCAKGSRAFAERHGLDWGDFLRNGVEADILEATGDAMAKRVVEWARTQQSQ